MSSIIIGMAATPILCASLPYVQRKHNEEQPRKTHNVFTAFPYFIRFYQSCCAREKVRRWRIAGVLCNVVLIEQVRRTGPTQFPRPVAEVRAGLQSVRASCFDDVDGIEAGRKPFSWLEDAKREATTIESLAGVWGIEQEAA